jgi:hypothetical protein
MFDDETTEAIKDKDPAMIEIIIEGMRMRFEAKRMEVAADQIKKKANKLLAPVMVAAELKTLKVLGMGTLTFTENVKNKSTSRDKMEKYLVEHGVSADLIAKARTAATTERTSEYQVKFNIEKD